MQIYKIDKTNLAPLITKNAIMDDLEKKTESSHKDRKHILNWKMSEILYA